MDALEALRTRRSIGLVLDKEIPEELINQVLEAGTWAPNHFKTEPWRFFVLTENGRKPLGETLAKIAAQKMDDPTTVENQQKLNNTKQKSLRAPVVIVAAVEPSDNPRVILKEEYAAVSAAVQNMLIAAHALGLGAIWRTGEPCYHPEMQKLFQLSDKGEVLGFIYMGYPNMNPPARKIKPVSEVTKWFKTESDF